MNGGEVCEMKVMNHTNRVALEACVQARNEGRDLAAQGNEIIREASKWSPELAAACEGAPTPPCPALYLTLRRKRGYEAWETMERGVRLQREMLKTFNEMHPPRPGRYGVVAAAAIRKQAAKPSKRTKRRLTERRKPSTGRRSCFSQDFSLLMSAFSLLISPGVVTKNLPRLTERPATDT
ncbi:hypothetical protein V6N12_035528 [Hibiscus sabdariffa]|uniref:Uncharacterized protein n=1 Tax=Hibiscus sabdariffa TaxID=183260 RepID=A0ABR2EMZ8_9ROSI